MLSREFNKMNMFTAVNAVLQLFCEVVAKIEAFSKAADKFNDKLVHIARRDAQYTTAASGATASKNSAADTLIDLTLRIANALFVLGNNTQNEPLKSQCRLRPSRLSRCRALELKRISKRIAELARQCVSELPAYGITESDLASHTEAFELFCKIRDEQQQRLAEAKSARGLLSEDLAEANDILKNQIDPLMELVKHSDAEFYNQYKAARVIRDLRGRGSKKEDTAETTDIPTAETGSFPQTEAA
jgi:hypothetical protein